MSESLASDVPQTHRHFSTDCFNRCWGLIEKSDRTADDDEQMLLLALASLWHWTQREDCTRRNRSIGYWQVSRVYALLRQGANAVQFAELCLAASDGESPFFVGYGQEALARGAMVAGDRERMEQHLELARRLALEVTDAEDRALLEKDLATIDLMKPSANESQFKKMGK